jgi:arylsulfatase A-like enzyme
VLRANGYATACIGKWHLGGEAYYPEKHGFDVNIAGTDKAAPRSYRAPWKLPTLTEGRDGDYLTDRLGDEAVKFIDRTKDKPFFLYLAHFAVHTPIQGRPDLVAKYKASSGRADARQRRLCGDGRKPRRQRRPYSRKLESWALTTIHHHLRRTTAAACRPPRTESRCGYGKASAYREGVRVPLIVHWPGVTRRAACPTAPVIDGFVSDARGHGRPEGAGIRREEPRTATA